MLIIYISCHPRRIPPWAVRQSRKCSIGKKGKRDLDYWVASRMDDARSPEDDAGVSVIAHGRRDGALAEGHGLRLT